MDTLIKITNKDYLINKDTLRDLAYKKIKEFILKGVIKAGDKILICAKTY